MKIRIYSDVHQEVKEHFNVPLFKIAKMDNEHEQVLVLAGDYISLRDLKHDKFVQDILSLSKRFMHIIYVFGNHEYYNGKIGGIYDKNNIDSIQNIADNISVLSRHTPSVVISGFKFIGATLWTDFAGKETHFFDVKNTSNDFKYIKSAHAGFSKYKPKNWLYEHVSDIKWIKQEVINSQGMPVIVVTHHSPYSKAIDPVDDPDNLYSKFYTSNQDDFIKANTNIKMWIHGHIHHPFDFKIGETRVYSNPIDYDIYEDKNYKRSLIEI